MKKIHDTYFPLRDRKAIYKVFTHIGLILALLYIHNTLHQPDTYTPSIVERKVIEDLIKSDSVTIRPSYYNNNNYKRSTTMYQSKKKLKSTTQQKNKVENEKFNFDPNTITKDSLILLGLSSKTASILINYRNKGGRFRKPEDLQKIYGMDRYYDRISDNIIIKKKKQVSEPKTTLFSKLEKKRPDSTRLKKARERIAKPSIKTIEKYPLNQVDTFQIMMVRGIGEKLSRRILKYRNKLGGFYSTDQLLEVYGLDGPNFKEVQLQFTVDTTLIKKIKINQATEEELKQHPYLGRRKGRIVFLYRRNHYPIKNMTDMKNVRIFKEEQLTQLRPYLDFTY